MSAMEAMLPFEAQSDSQTVRDCGAACLSMVYGSFGKPIPRTEIWPAISGRNRVGSVSSLTHLMVKDAIQRGFVAVAVQARHPLQALRLCQISGIRAILNHRLSPDTTAGHYTVLVGIDENAVVLHDPFYGPSRRVPHADLLELWQPRSQDSEVMGFLVIGIAAEPSVVQSCWLCHAALPSATACPQCEQPVGLQPNSLLGCIDTTCITRMWNYVCCPNCDCGFTVSPKTPASAIVASSVTAKPTQPVESAGSAGEPPKGTPSAADQMRLDGFFVELDKFSAQIRSIPGMENHPRILRQLELLEASKQSLTLARAEALANLKAALDRCAKMALTAKQEQAAHRKKMEELSRPAPPLDGNALGHALLKNLGFKD